MAEKDVIITFDTLFDLARREKYRKKSRKLTQNSLKMS